MAKKSNRRRTLLSDIYLSSLNKLPSIDRSKEASSFVRAGGPYERSGYAQRAYINIRRSERTIRRKVPTSRRTCSLSSRSGFVRNVNDGKFEKKKTKERMNERLLHRAKVPRISCLSDSRKTSNRRILTSVLCCGSE